MLAQEQLELTPVDYVSRAIVALSRRKASLGQAFHLFNPVTISVGELIDCTNAFGYAVRQTTYDAWLGELARVTEEESGNALVPFAPLFPKKEQEAQGRTPKRAYDNQNALVGLAGTSIKCPPADSKLLSTYLSYLAQSGFLPALQSMDEL